MDDDFTEFCSLVGKETTCYGVCQECGDIFIRTPETYDKPKIECDPERIDNCKFFLPVCGCREGRVMFTEECLKQCTFPDCEYGSGDG